MTFDLAPFVGLAVFLFAWGIVRIGKDRIKSNQGLIKEIQRLTQEVEYLTEEIKRK
jgi:hypothetical protein